MGESESSIARNLRDVRQRIAAACARVGRDPSSVRLVAVTKYAILDQVRELVSLGMTELGEGRPQQLVERAGLIAEPVRWHLIGPLQRNKARRVTEVAAWIHSVDSLRLLQSLDKLGAESDARSSLLLEVNISGEAQKHGFAADELAARWEDVLACRHLSIVGLMTMAPYDATPEKIRGVFRTLRELRDRLAARPDSLPLPELSMGMSGDFEIAVEEGATMIRVGSRLFEDAAPLPTAAERDDATSNAAAVRRSV